MKLESETINNLNPKKKPPVKDAPDVKSHEDLPRVNPTLSKFPSRSLAYAPGAEMQYRPYTFGEVKRLNQTKSLSTKQKFKEILKGVECNFHDMDITVGDALYVALLRKISTLGSTKVILKYKCGKCQKVGSHQMNTQDLEFDDMLKGYSDDEAELPIVAEFSWGETSFMPCTLQDYYLLIDQDKENDEIALMAVQSDMEFHEAYEKFDKITDFEDARILDEVDKLLYHALTPVKFKCRNKLSDDSLCENTITIELDGGQALVLPFREREVNVKGRIRFGKKTKFKSRSNK